jgi:hypothetical protein
LYKQKGVNLSQRTLWRKLGATPMIGQNDFTEEVFTLEDATSLNDFAIEKNIGRMSMWSANRDIPCGENYVNIKVVRVLLLTSTNSFAYEFPMVFNAQNLLLGLLLMTP